ncbi:MAG: DUF3598 family protein [Cyanobacteria bacterium P01_A01_bin.114]
MHAQWDNLRKNLGNWYGSFNQYSPDGVRLKATASQLTLVEDQPNQQMTLVLKRTPSGGIPNTMVRTFRYPGAAPHIYFFETGAFSQGPLQWQAFSQFGAELALKDDDRRRRCVYMYAGHADKTSRPAYITLIQEQRGESAPENLPENLSETALANLSGRWGGTAARVSSHQLAEDASQAPFIEHSHWQLIPSLTPPNTRPNIPSEASAEAPFTYQSQIGEIHHQTAVAHPQGRRLVCQTDSTWQMILLPGATFCILPQQIQPGRPFTLEVGWLTHTHRCQRLIRCYSAQGEWTHLILTAEEKLDG